MEPETQTLVFQGNDKRFMKRTALLTFLTMFSLFFLLWAALNLPSYTPLLPTFTLISASTTSQPTHTHQKQRYYDLNSRFIIHNPNKNGLVVFKSLNANIDLPRSSAIEASLIVRNATMIEADEGLSGYSRLELGFLGRVEYQGKANWLKKQIGIEVTCEQEHVMVNNNATKGVTTFGPMGQCRVKGLWFTVYSWLIVLILLGFFVFGVGFFVLFTIEAQRHEFIRVMTHYGIAWKKDDGGCEVKIV